MKKNILVTGGAGYVGSHACKALASAEYTPVTFDNLAYGHEWAVKWGPLERGDILDRVRLDEVISRYRPHAVLHFAGFAYVGESVEKPEKYYRNNVLGTLTLLEAMLASGVRNFVFSSSCSTYGIPRSVPISELHPQNPVNPYGATKLMVERMLEDFDSAHGLRSVCLRYFNASGADPDGELGESHDPETHLIPLVLLAALGRRESVSIYGDDYPTDDGTCVRDYVHVSDLAEAHVQALKYLEEGNPSGRFNLGTGNGVSVREVVEIARQVTGRPIKAVNAARRPGDPPILVAEARLAAEKLHWSPRYADVRQSVAHAWSWLTRADREQPGVRAEISAK